MTVHRKSRQDCPTDPDGWPVREGSYAKIVPVEFRDAPGYCAPAHVGIVSYVTRDAKGWVIEVCGGPLGPGGTWKKMERRPTRPENVRLLKPPDLEGEERTAYEQIRRNLLVQAERRRHPPTPIRDNKRGRGIRVEKETGK